jgi:hypothetical protein
VEKGIVVKMVDVCDGFFAEPGPALSNKSTKTFVRGEGAYLWQRVLQPDTLRLSLPMNGGQIAVDKH